MAMHKTLLITGVSSGFGQALAQEALGAGHTVIGTARSQQSKAAFEALSPNAHGRLLDVTDFAAMTDFIDEIEANVGGIDVLVNNAGYGHEGVMEESSLAEMKHQFDVNVFGAVALIKAVLPHMRQRKLGHIINITSIGGHVASPGIAYYCGSKFALEGISESLSKELRTLGIAVTAVAPGSFRTDWAGRSMVRTPRSIAAYDDSFDPIRNGRLERDGQQPGNPSKAALAILALIDAEAPPAHLLLGSDAIQRARAKAATLLAEIEQWEALSRSTDG